MPAGGLHRFITAASVTICAQGVRVDDDDAVPPAAAPAAAAVAASEPTKPNLAAATGASPAAAASLTSSVAAPETLPQITLATPPPEPMLSVDPVSKKEPAPIAIEYKQPEEPKLETLAAALTPEPLITGGTIASLPPQHRPEGVPLDTPTKMLPIINMYTKGANDVTPGSKISPLATAAVSKEPSAEGAEVYATGLVVPKPFDCGAGFKNWEAGWSKAKKVWCCTNENKGCEGTEKVQYDCRAGLENWALGWSEHKKEWCCQHEGLGRSSKTACADAGEEETAAKQKYRAFAADAKAHAKQIEQQKKDAATAKQQKDLTGVESQASSAEDAVENQYAQKAHALIDDANSKEQQLAGAADTLEGKELELLKNAAGNAVAKGTKDMQKAADDETAAIQSIDGQAAAEMNNLAGAAKSEFAAEDAAAKTYAQMSEAQRQKKLAEILALDKNADGKITADELASLSKADRDFLRAALSVNGAAEAEQKKIAQDAAAKAAAAAANAENAVDGLAKSQTQMDGEVDAQRAAAAKNALAKFQKDIGDADQQEASSDGKLTAAVGSQLTGDEMGMDGQLAKDIAAIEKAELQAEGLLVKQEKDLTSLESKAEQDVTNKANQKMKEVEDEEAKEKAQIEASAAAQLAKLEAQLLATHKAALDGIAKDEQRLAGKKEGLDSQLNKALVAGEGAVASKGDAAKVKDMQQLLATLAALDSDDSSTKGKVDEALNRKRLTLIAEYYRQQEGWEAEVLKKYGEVEGLRRIAERKSLEQAAAQRSAAETSAASARGQLESQLLSGVGAAETHLDKLLLANASARQQKLDAFDSALAAKMARIEELRKITAGTASGKAAEERRRAAAAELAELEKSVEDATKLRKNFMAYLRFFSVAGDEKKMAEISELLKKKYDAIDDFALQGFTGAVNGRIASERGAESEKDAANSKIDASEQAAEDLASAKAKAGADKKKNAELEEMEREANAEIKKAKEAEQKRLEAEAKGKATLAAMQASKAKADAAREAAEAATLKARADEQAKAAAEMQHQAEAQSQRAAQSAAQADKDAVAATTSIPLKGSASLAAPAKAGDTKLEVSSASGFAAGDRIAIGEGSANEESNTVLGFGSLVLTTPLKFNHAAGESIVTERALFDCSESTGNMETGWSNRKRSWCCAHKGVGCNVVPFTCEGSEEGWSEDQRLYCASHPASPSSSTPVTPPAAVVPVVEPLVPEKKSSTEMPTLMPPVVPSPADTPPAVVSVKKTSPASPFGEPAVQHFVLTPSTAAPTVVAALPATGVTDLEAGKGTPTSGAAVAAATKVQVPIKTPEKKPTEPGCYIFTPHDCPNQAYTARAWMKDSYCELKGADNDKASCEGKCKEDYAKWCGAEPQMYFVPTLSNVASKAKTAPAPAPAEVSKKAATEQSR
eukprot:TRINITY_DN5875_c1_g1_i1.p1 TRINITY_DN5875_c1_g1~~TRINITY_DN5875_c1_g1_i1.p1  ORF type:complete len:1406 (+),score=579.06 TRINITY_DN5875_c1_g1_i1:122-4339(+)